MEAILKRDENFYVIEYCNTIKLKLGNIDPDKWSLLVYNNFAKIKIMSDKTSSNGVTFIKDTWNNNELIIIMSSNDLSLTLHTKYNIFKTAFMKIYNDLKK